ncbi:SDR family NAD(P)-dependent oxidoreductase [Streptomyces phytohabitans]|uniref:SDR family NAD(P)-dependent oxidoreductase n=1 Tax=Streptomyces phytohabitans TaxID=1150371 RepID=UPI00345C0284
MTHRQHPIPSGFTAAATAADVLAGVDLTGRNAVVTGGHTGIGSEVVRALAGAGATVTTGSRDPDRAREELAEAGIDGVRSDRLDLLDPASVDAFAARLRTSGRPLHILVNSVGIPAPATRERDARGYEKQFAVHHLGHFQLTLALLPALRAARGARVVNVSSGAQRFSDIRWDDPHFDEGYDPGTAYAQSKTANVLHAVELDRRWSADGVRGFAAHPGVVVGTNLNRAADPAGHRAMGLIDETGRPVIDPAGGKKNREQGAATVVFGAASPLLDGLGGVYLKDSDISVLDDEPRPLTADSVPSEVASHSVDPVSARRLWELSEELLAVRVGG